MDTNIKEQVVKNGFWNVISGLINRGGGFVLVILLSRLLMPEGFGQYSLAMTVSLFFITFSDIGINQTLIRYVSLGINETNDKSATYLNYLFKIKFFVTLILSLILFLISYPLSYFVFDSPPLFIPLFLLGFYVFFISLTGFFESLFFVRKKVKYISLKESLLIILKLIAIFIIIYFVSPEFKLITVFLSFVIISILIFFFSFFLSKRSYPSLYKKTEKLKEKKGLLKFIFFLGTQNISLIITSMATIILLGIFLAEKYVGYYSVSWALIHGISSLLFSFSYVLLPIYTNMEEQGFQHLLKKTFRLFFILALPISFGLALLSRYFILTIYGHDYLPASIPLGILSFLIPCIITTNLALTSFSARNKQKNFSIWMLVFTAILLILNYIFIKIFLVYSGEMVVIGVSIANLISFLFFFVISIFLLKRELGVNVISSWILKPLFSCLIMSSFIFILSNYLGEMNLIKGIGVILVGAFIYLSSLFLIKGIEKEEIKEILKSLFKSNKS